ncbi:MULTISPECIES: FxsA family protein [Agrobacterium]|uniref:Membrane protein FxsA n=1 Tax=Agrobacterium tumefaciens TaxID=358 RepID=A0AAE6BBL7_AGRTU|nr:MULTISPECIES: FxsA family protein [Agrobacterium]QCL74309.1 membrane protein FxsA [Agrobacterium tumefaciens]QCL79885.1 membrane protein FxsA [Agrobacterium tumefaciens]CUX30023.1 Cytoplasmic membrane protein [Agrobacterium sp. NCPPB 925]
MRFSFLPIVILMMPILEIAGFIIVGKAIGLWLTLALVLFTSFLGLLILRLGGIGMVRNLQDAGRTGAQPADELVNGAMRVVAGILLIIPGFITDILGLLLLSPAIRRFFWKAFGPRVAAAGSFRQSGPRSGDYSGFRNGPGPAGNSKVVDLDEEEFHREGPKDSPWSNRPDDRDLPKP